MTRAGRQTSVRLSRLPPARVVLTLDRIYALCCRHDRLGPKMRLSGYCPCVDRLKHHGEVVMCPLIHRLMGFEEAA